MYLIEHWGGVFEASHDYHIISTDASQTNVKVLKKFDAWDFENCFGIGQRLPYINGDYLTTQSRAWCKSWGSITSEFFVTISL